MALENKNGPAKEDAIAMNGPRESPPAGQRLSIYTDEPLTQLARFSFDWAEVLCDPSHGCMPYHRTWSMIRLLESKGAKPAGGGFFGRELAAVAQEGRCRILLSGAADTGLAAMVLGQTRPVGIEPEFVLIDRCETTVEQNRLFARSAGFALETHRADIRGCDCAPVQAVVAHSALNFFDRSARQQVVDSWARSLKPGGRLLLSQRLLSEKDQPRGPRGSAEIGRRLSTIEKAAVAAHFPAAAVAELKTAVEALWGEPLHEDRTTYSDLADMLKQSNLTIIGSEQHHTGKSVSPLAAADSVRTIPRYEIVAVRM
ncbi:class I SAM-dependent methyltransferase [Mesorhizobium sp. M0659]|uniref:class I SAM-dependent methyltransferase n=1 Tax=Mesorhizobium sp. M0659 TaxID=2956980 RepID=UPI00333C0B81